MNIFVTDTNPIVCARNLDNKRVIKMILESAQMLSAAMHIRGVLGAPYKLTHKNHPCTVWARTSTANYRWLLDHFEALCYEYNERYNKTHKCFSLMNIFTHSEKYMPAGDLTPFENCTPHKNLPTINAYRLILKEKWAVDKRTPAWTNRLRPCW